MHVKVTSIKFLLCENIVYWHSAIRTRLWALNAEGLCIKTKSGASRFCTYIREQVKVNHYVANYVNDFLGLQNKLIA